MTNNVIGMKLPNQGYQSYMQGAGGTPMMPGGPGMVIPPEMFAELQKKLKEKFPDANIPLTQEGLLSNVPIQLPMSNMRFKPPMHLVPDSSGYYGDNNNQNKKKVNKEKRKEKEVKEPEPVVQESEELFKNYNEEEKQISNEEETHMQELDSFDKLTTEDK